MKYRLVIFDFDGTLANTLPWLTGVVNQVAERYGFRHVPESEREHLRGLDAHSILKHVGVPLWKTPIIASHVRSLMNAQIDQIRLFDGVDRMLRQLSDLGVTLAMVSSNSEENVRAVLGPENASRMSHYDCGASMFGKSAKLRRMLARTGIAARDAIYIGDEIRDIAAARSARMAAGAVAWGYNTLPALLAHRPDEVFRHIDDIVAAVTGTPAHPA